MSVALTLDDFGVPDVYGYGTTASGDVHAFRAPPGFGTFDLGTLGGTGVKFARPTCSLLLVYHSLRAAKHTRCTSAPPRYRTSAPSVARRVTQTASRRQQQSLIIVGGSTLAGDATTHAFIYQNNAMSDLGATLGGPNNVANAVNVPGHVVGYADLPVGPVHHAFLWNGGVTTDLGSLGGNSEAFAINAGDVVVGRSELASGAQHAFRYIGGVMQDLGTLGGSSSEATDVNASGVVVGWAETSEGVRHAFIWREGVMTDLEHAVPAGTGWALQAATGIADLNGIVG